TGQMPQTQQQSYAPTLGLPPNYQYGGLSNNMALSTGGIAAPPYMPTNSYPQYNQQHLAAQYAPNNYMQSAYGWNQPAGGNNAASGKVQYPTQSSEKK
ncbi:19447_t:CDS:1, partial [Gigaspora rosea]